jgi:ATP-binding cassette subfamily F protein uup
LQEYPGTLLLVSHDRAFLDNVVTQTLAAEGGGQWRECVGGYGDWLRQRSAPVEEKPAEKTSRPAVTATAPKARIKLSFKERRELEALPAEIAALEDEQKEILARMSRADYYTQGAQQIKDDRSRSAEIEKLLLEKLERWDALESLAKKSD